MNISEYKKESSRTFRERTEGIDPKTTDLLHCAIGMTTETGEIQDQFKRHIFYKRPLDIVNLKEEIGDVMWYLMNMCRLLDMDLEDVMATNIAKLKARFPENFTSEHAVNRDLEKERKILEGDNGTN